MSNYQQANAYGQPREGQPLLPKRRQVTHRQPQESVQVTWTTITPISGNRPTLFPAPILSRSPTRSLTRRGSLEGGHSVPRNSVRQTQKLSVSDLPPLHGPQLTVVPPCQLSLQKSRTSSDSVKLPPLPTAAEAAAASGSFPRGITRAMGAASDSIKLPPLPPAAAAASGSSPRGTARGPMASGHREIVPPSLWGTVAAGRVQGTPSLENRTEGLWQGSAARQGHRLPPVSPARGMPLRTGTQLARESLENSETEEGCGGNIDRDLFGGISPYLSEGRSITSTCNHEQSSVRQEVDTEPQVVPDASNSTDSSGAETGNCSELLHPTGLEEQNCVSENLQSWGTAPKQLEEKWEEEELHNTEAAGEQDTNPQSLLLALLEESELEAEASAPAGDPWDEGHSRLFLTSEPEETSGFSASPLPGGPCEDSGTHQPAKHAVLHRQPCVGTDTLMHLMRKKREELEKLEEDQMYAELFGDIWSSIDNEESSTLSSCVLRDPSKPTLEAVADPSVQHSPYHVTQDVPGKRQNYSVSPGLSDSDDSPPLEFLLNELLEKLEEEERAEGWEEPVSPLSLPPRDEEDEPAPSPPDSDASDPLDEGHSKPLLGALSEESQMLACTLPADPVEKADTAGMEAGPAQAAPTQAKPCEAVVPAGARRAHPSSAASEAIPQPPAPQRWRSILKMARRALRRVFSFSCLRGQQEE